MGERGIVTCNALSAGPRTQRRITHQSLGNFSRGVTQKFHVTFGRAHNVSTHTVFRIGFGPIGDRTGSDGLGRTVLFVGQTVHTRHTVARHFRRRVNIVHLDGPTQTTDGIRSDAVPMSAGFLKIHKIHKKRNPKGMISQIKFRSYQSTINRPNFLTSGGTGVGGRIAIKARVLVARHNATEARFWKRITKRLRKKQFETVLNQNVMRQTSVNRHQINKQIVLRTLLVFHRAVSVGAVRCSPAKAS